MLGRRSSIQVICFAVAASLLLAACSDVGEEDLFGTWVATLDILQEGEDAIQATLAENETISFSDLELIFTIGRGGNFSLIADVEFTYLEVKPGIALVRRYSVRQKMSGTWRYTFNWLDLSIQESDAIPQNDLTAGLFKSNPNIRKAFTAPKTGLFEALRWRVEEATKDELLLVDDIYGAVRFERFQR